MAWWLEWLYEAKGRYALTILNYVEQGLPISLRSIGSLIT